MGGGDKNYKKIRFIFEIGFKSLKINHYFFYLNCDFRIFVYRDDFSF